MLEESGKVVVESNAMKHTWVPKLGRFSILFEWPFIHLGVARDATEPSGFINNRLLLWTKDQSYHSSRSSACADQKTIEVQNSSPHAAQAVRPGKLRT